MKIAIYETVHLDWVIPLAEFLKESPYSVSFFVHTKMRKDIESSLTRKNYAVYNWIYLEDQSAYSLFKLLNSYSKLERYDLFWLNTNDSKHIVFAFLKMKYKAMKLLINVHEINNFFRPRVSTNPKRLMRFISKKILSKSADAYLLNADKMKETIESDKLTTKPSYSFNPVYYKETNNVQQTDEKFIVVIAGTVDERRRNYQVTLQAWKTFVEDKSSLNNAELILAGSIMEYGHAIAKICREDKLLHNTVRLFDDEIPEQNFQQIVAGASVLLSCQNIKTSISDNITEEYGLTKTSGNIYDAIRHAKPLIIPSLLNIPIDIETSAMRYSEYKEMISIFENLSNNKTALDLLTKKAVENAQKFSYEIMQRRVLLMLNGILKS